MPKEIQNRGDIRMRACSVASVLSDSVTLWTVAHSPDHGILYERILEWVAMLSSRGSS